MATDDVLTPLVDFINKNSNVADVQWDRRMSPRLLFNPYSHSYDERKIVAQLFLCLLLVYALVFDFWCVFF